MKRLLSAIVIVAIPGTSVAAEPNCRHDDDVGKSVCVAGVLYRCACRQAPGGAVCSWDNAASACSALTETEGSSGASRLGSVAAPPTH